MTPFVAVVRELPTLVVSDAEIARVVQVSLRELGAIEEQRVLREENGMTWRGWWYVATTRRSGARPARWSTRCSSWSGRRPRGR